MAKLKEPKKLTSVGRVHRRQLPAVHQPKSWWRMSRRVFIVGGAGAVLATGVWYAARDDTTEVDKDSLDLQRAQGWNVGSEGKTLVLPNVQTNDSQQQPTWKKYLDSSTMLAAYQPKLPAWTPYFVPTLIQSLQSESLRQQLAPIFAPDMLASYQSAQTIAGDFLTNAQNVGETAFIVDLPGRQSVAFGAGMADAAQLITTFDNFPHPLGVTPSHETLGAMLYYAGEIETKQAKTAPTAPPVFMLDSNRLAPYKDADTQFDNRYLVGLPSAAKLRERGIKSVVYVMPDRARTEELDDLNDDFVDYKNAGMTVTMLPLSDFVPVVGTVERKQPDGTVQTVSERHIYYGGSPATHWLFFHSYPHFIPIPAYTRRYPGYAPITSGRAPAVPRPVSPPAYAPRPRPTMFSGTRIGGSATGVGRSKPSGFGRTTVRLSPSSRVVGVRSGRSGYYAPRRSGSFGRGVRSSG
jgi:hypothetical protein